MRTAALAAALILAACDEPEPTPTIAAGAWRVAEGDGWTCNVAGNAGALCGPGWTTTGLLISDIDPAGSVLLQWEPYGEFRGETDVAQRFGPCLSMTGEQGPPRRSASEICPIGEDTILAELVWSRDDHRCVCSAVFAFDHE